jgi:predicted enzyme related to lactoylglutathione lyase
MSGRRRIYCGDMALGRVAQIHLSVTDIDRAVAFYRDVLEIPFLFRVEGQPMAFFQSGDVRLYLGKPESAKYVTRTVHYFAVDDLHAERARLESRGVEFLDDEPHLVHRGGKTELWMTGFQDPDGHYLILMQEKPST